MYRFQNVSRRPRERFNFPADMWAANLPCDPCIKSRGSHPTYYPEFHMFPGPQELGVTGDNSFHTLFARTWAFLMCDDDRWFLLQWIGSAHLIAEGLQSPGWKVIQEPLLDLPGLGCGAQRRFTAAFDQSARLVVAYEEAGSIHVTRWDTVTQAYLQNVSFEGADPSLLMDAAVTDPLGYPPHAQQALSDGVPVLFEWLPEPAWRENAIPDSDVALFYLTPDRLGVRARAQRDLYAVEYGLHDYSVQVLLDYAVALPGRYQLLLSDAVGAKLEEMLISADYVGGHIVNPRDRAALDVLVNVEPAAHAQDIWHHAEINPLPVTASVETTRYQRQVYPYSVTDALDVTSIASEARYQETTIVRDEREPLNFTASVEDAFYDQLVSAHAASEAIDVTASVESGRYQEVE